MQEKWSEKYKKSIDCKNPKGFSQKAHCAGRKKKMKSFKQYIKEDVYGGLSTIYHRTHSIESIDAIKDSGFHTGSGAMYGRGIYGTYSLESQLNDLMNATYGKYIIKAKVNNNRILFLDMDQAKKVYGKNHTLVDQLKSISSRIPITNEIERISNILLKKPKLTSTFALKILRERNVKEEIYGISFTGSRDGNVLVIYNEKTVTPMSYNTTSKNPKKLDSRKWIDIKNRDLIQRGLDTELDGFIKNIAPKDIKSLKGDKKLLKRYDWLQWGDVQDAEIELTPKKLIWKNGIFSGGLVRDVIWENGTFQNADWDNGTWCNGTFCNGRWAYGTWKNGTWENGTWESGKWNNGIWCKGIWYDGTWKCGEWFVGQWYDGIWQNGKWHKGSWDDGTWKCGEIYSKKYNTFVCSSVNPRGFKQKEKKSNSLEELQSKVK